MAVIIAEFFGLIGLDQAPPSTFSELIVWLVVALIGLALVCGVFRVIGRLVDSISNFRRW